MYSKPYILFLVHFHADRDYFECHEILEEYWKKVDANNKESIWVAFILLAVSCYHHRRENFAGAIKTIKKSYSLFKQNKHQLPSYGLDTVLLFSLLESNQTNIENLLSYKSFILPIDDAELEKQCQKYCEQMGLIWKNNNLAADDIIHRHLTRDRSIVIQEREAAIMARMHHK
ncbi:DUF309 domain-containing protein [Niallia sp. 01092]|uniref:DUF309 domain-containing protein n=1 Tax=unclassified Niallia TaxID=2837522 RepID=UPI003FD4DEC6